MFLFQWISYLYWNDNERINYSFFFVQMSFLWIEYTSMQLGKIEETCYVRHYGTRRLGKPELRNLLDNAPWGAGREWSERETVSPSKVPSQQLWGFLKLEDINSSVNLILELNTREIFFKITGLLAYLKTHLNRYFFVIVEVVNRLFSQPTYYFRRSQLSCIIVSWIFTCQ